VSITYPERRKLLSRFKDRVQNVYYDRARNAPGYFSVVLRPGWRWTFDPQGKTDTQFGTYEGALVALANHTEKSDA
jgi:hypothetical protein